MENNPIIYSKWTLCTLFGPSSWMRDKTGAGWTVRLLPMWIHKTVRIWFPHSSAHSMTQVDISDFGGKTAAKKIMSGRQEDVDTIRRVRWDFTSSHLCVALCCGKYSMSHMTAQQLLNSGIIRKGWCMPGWVGVYVSERGGWIVYDTVRIWELYI